MHPLLISLLAASLASAGSAPFDPHAYPTSLATCTAVNRTPNISEPVDITLRYVDINPTAPKTILMVHGWPSLWSSWANQIQEFENDYRLVVPDLRGFGGSGHTAALRGSGTMGDFVGDLVCVLGHAGVHSAICLGHDWGTQVCFEAARMRPDIFSAVIGITIPYMPTAGPFVPMMDLAAVFPTLAYQIYFDTETSAAAKEMNTNIRRTLRATLRTVASPPPAGFLTSTHSFLDAWKDIDEIPPVPFLSLAEEDYFVDAYTLQGFDPTFAFYLTENRMGSWKLAQTQGNVTVPQPTLSIYPLNDPVGDMVGAAQILKTETFLPQHTTITLPGAHWVHMEFPDAVNEAIRGWLVGLEGAEDAGAGRRAEDEL